MKTKLKPCPFCGSEAELIRDTIPCGDYPDEYDQYVVCSSCGAETRHYDPDTIPNAIEYAVASWNTRPIDGALQSRIAELEKALHIADDEYMYATSQYYNEPVPPPSSYDRWLSLAIYPPKGGSDDTQTL